MGKIIAIKPEWDPIAKLSTEAINEGTTYGKLVAKRYCSYQDRLSKQAPQDKRSLACRNCGGLIPSTSENLEFCCRECRNEWEKREEDARKRGVFKESKKQEHSGSERRCPYCGQPVTGKKKYCDYRCNYLFNQEKAKQRSKEQAIRKRDPEYRRPNLVCRRCGKQITSSCRSAYCGPECAKAAHIEQKRHSRQRANRK